MKPPVQYAMTPPRVDAPKVGKMKPVQQPKVAKMRGIDEALDYYLGPTGIPDKLRAVNSMLNPVETLGGSMRASQRLFAPETDGWGRVQAAGDMLSGFAGFVAPMVAAAKVGAPAVAGVVDAFTGISTAPATQAAKTTATDFALGESGAFAGLGAKTADRAAAARAEELLNAGVSRDEVWRNTGWMRGVDGKMRFEIDDSGMALTDQATAVLQPKVPYDLEANFASGVSHPNLAANYDVAGGNFALGRYEQNAGSYYPATGAIRIKATDPVEARSTTLHEIQHHLQKLEGFASGSSPGEMAGAHLGLAQRVSDHADAVALLREVQANGGDWDAALKDLRELDMVSDDGIILAQKFGSVQTAQRAYDEMAAAKMKLEPMREPGQWQQDTGYGPYKRTAGEVEARNVQTRANMTAAERRATPPWATQDVPDDQQLLVFGDRLQLSAPRRGINLGQ